MVVSPAGLEPRMAKPAAIYPDNQQNIYYRIKFNYEVTLCAVTTPEAGSTIMLVLLMLAGIIGVSSLVG